MDLANFINLKIMRHPTNWLIVLVAMFIVGMGADLIVTYFSQPQNISA